MGAIIWQKVTTCNTTGGATIMGLYPYPRNGNYQDRLSLLSTHRSMTVIGKTSQFSSFFVVSNILNKFTCASTVKSSKYISTVLAIEKHPFVNSNV